MYEYISIYRREKKESENLDSNLLFGVCSMDCGGFVLECPKKNLEHGLSPCSVSDHC